MTCVFCMIASGELRASILYQDNELIAFNDISPQAPIHKIIIPRQHIATINEAASEESKLILGRMVQTASDLAKQLNIAEDGYRLVMNCNAKGGQTVFHIHLHLLGGRQMAWPPG
jgi:histidine triad (HIT) family protein